MSRCETRYRDSPVVMVGNLVLGLGQPCKQANGRTKEGGEYSRSTRNEHSNYAVKRVCCKVLKYYKMEEYVGTWLKDELPPALLFF